MVSIERRWWGLSTWITAPAPFDKNKIANADYNSEGLCGNYNNDGSDDFQGKPARMFAESYRYTFWN